MRLLALAFLFAMLAGEAVLGQSSLVVIVHPSRTESLTADELARIYLKKKNFWTDGAAIRPINRESGSPSRELFDRIVVAGDEPDLVNYWNQRYFHGVFPPATLASDAAVIRYVASEARAIGYVAADAVDDSVRVLMPLPRD